MPGDDTDLIEIALPSTLTVADVGELVLPENAEIDSVTVDLVDGPSGANAEFDVLVGGDSIFETAIGTLRQPSTAQGDTDGGDIGATDTKFVITPDETGFAPVEGQVILVESEQMQITGVTGSPLTTGASPEYEVTVTREFNGSTGATHAGGTDVLPAKPTIVDGSTATVGKYVPSHPAARNIPPLSSGDALSVACTAIGSGTGGAGGGGSVVVQLSQR